eukprot:tig00000269_g23722.t1
MASVPTHATAAAWLVHAPMAIRRVGFGSPIATSALGPAGRDAYAEYIVVLREHAEMRHLAAVTARARAAAEAERAAGAGGDEGAGGGGVRVRHVFRHAFLGFSARCAPALPAPSLSFRFFLLSLFSSCDAARPYRAPEEP